MNLGYYFRNPHLVLARLRYWAWERQNPDKPWLTPGAVGFLDAALTPAMTGVEFGSGRSTRWFAGKVGRLTSVEHHAGWHAQVRAGLQAAGVANVDYRLIPLDHPEAEPERDGYDPTPRYVAEPLAVPADSLDFVLVDGHYRTTCIRACADRVKPGGLLVVDDINMWDGGPPAPAGWTLAHRSGNGLKETAVWRRPG